MPFIAVRDINIYYEIHGDGPRVLFISGTGGDLRNQPNVFAGPLSKSFHTLAYDQRGLGQTDKPDIPYSMADYADDAAELIRALDWSPCHVIGVSFGGMVAQHLAIRHPGLIQRMVLCCTSPGGAGGASYPLHELTALSPRDRAERSITLANVQRDAAWQAANPDKFKQLVDFSLNAATAFADEPGRAMGAQRQLEARRHHDVYDQLPNLPMPVMIAAGRHDGIALPSAQEAMQQQIPNATLQFFDGGHLFMIEDSTAYPAIIQFLQSA